MCKFIYCSPNSSIFQNKKKKKKKKKMGKKKVELKSVLKYIYEEINIMYFLYQELSNDTVD